MQGHNTHPRKQLIAEEERRELREIFELVDKDGGKAIRRLLILVCVCMKEYHLIYEWFIYPGGTISVEELGDLMATLGMPTSMEQLKFMVKEIDTDGNGVIDFEGTKLTCASSVDLLIRKRNERLAYTRVHTHHTHTHAYTRVHLYIQVCRP